MSSKIEQGGSRANKSGHIFEDMMLPIFREHGFEIFNNSELKKEPSPLKNVTKYVIKNAPFTTIYNQQGKTEFVICDATAIDENGDNYLRKIRVEAKWQQSTGSVDEKYPYMLLNGIYKYPEREIIFVVDGNGYKPGARKWLEDRVSENWLDYQQQQHKSIKVMKINEFVAWFNKEF